MDSFFSSQVAICIIVVLTIYVYYKWSRAPPRVVIFGHDEDDDDDIALAKGPAGNPNLIGAAQRPQIHPHNTQTIHTTNKISNNTMDAVASIKGTGLFDGSEIKPRARTVMQRVKPQDILAATTRPRGTPTPGVFKKNSNRQIRPEPVVKEGVGHLQTVSNLKDIHKRETFSPLFSQSIDGKDFDI